MEKEQVWHSITLIYPLAWENKGGGGDSSSPESRCHSTCYLLASELHLVLRLFHSTNNEKLTTKHTVQHFIGFTWHETSRFTRGLTVVRCWAIIVQNVVVVAREQTDKSEENRQSTVSDRLKFQTESWVAHCIGRGITHIHMRWCVCVWCCCWGGRQGRSTLSSPYLPKYLRIKLMKKSVEY